MDNVVAITSRNTTTGASNTTKITVPEIITNLEGHPSGIFVLGMTITIPYFHPKATGEVGFIVYLTIDLKLI